MLRLVEKLDYSVSYTEKRESTRCCEVSGEIHVCIPHGLLLQAKTACARIGSEEDDRPRVDARPVRLDKRDQAFALHA